MSAPLIEWRSLTQAELMQLARAAQAEINERRREFDEVSPTQETTRRGRGKGGDDA